jgi:hypothetical protein
MQKKIKIDNNFMQFRHKGKKKRVKNGISVFYPTLLQPLHASSSIGCAKKKSVICKTCHLLQLKKFI